ncbi:hypothetical protein EVAR_45992_1 [Eumeta japonica]|uniref:Uncharacterized protein n=1 Tax=Eumeta variegata TaxID=151549 RepID=A0A4C1XB46_EUMVA|nr:hypothetical protein EVAR_45992_1 [Eumeta japonica]
MAKADQRIKDQTILTDAVLDTAFRPILKVRTIQLTMLWRQNYVKKVDFDLHSNDTNNKLGCNGKTKCGADGSRPLSAIDHPGRLPAPAAPDAPPDGVMQSYCG